MKYFCKKNKQAWNCLDNLILQYYSTSNSLIIIGNFWKHLTLIHIKASFFFVLYTVIPGYFIEFTYEINKWNVSKIKHQNYEVQFYEPPELGNNIFTTWSVLNSEVYLTCKYIVYLTCISFWKFHDDLKACLEVIRLPSWSENVKFSVKVQFVTFLTPWKIGFWINDNLTT